MKILLVGGFLGSGKTSLIRSVLQGIADSGGTAAIIENEIGENGIDDQLLAESKFEITPLFGGCVCCQISGDLISAVSRIRTELAPDWLIIEATGIAFLSELRELLERRDPTLPVFGIAVVDITRWARLYKAMPELMRNQLEGAEIILINKTDVKTPELRELDELRSLGQAHAVLLPCSPAAKASGRLWKTILSILGGENEPHL